MKLLIAIYSISVLMLVYTNYTLHGTNKKLLQAITLRDTTISLLKTKDTLMTVKCETLEQTISYQKNIAWQLYRRGWWKSALYTSVAFSRHGYPPSNINIETQIKKDSITVKEYLK